MQKTTSISKLTDLDILNGIDTQGGRPRSEILQTLQFLASSTDALSNCIYNVRYFIQETKVEKLKSSLDDAMSAHKKAMDDNEKLLNDLKKANNTIRVSSRQAMLF